MTRAWAQTISGRHVTIARPEAREIDPLTDLPEQLARIGRYNGAVPGGMLSVAQHCVMISDAILDETGDADLAAIGLLHDAHEYIIGDITIPIVDGLAEIEAELRGPDSGVVRQVIREAKWRGDAAIFAACGVPFPPSDRQRQIVKGYDIRMLVTERRQLLASSPRRWAAIYDRAKPITMRGGLKLWPIAVAADEYRNRLRVLCPAVNRRAGA